MKKKVFAFFLTITILVSFTIGVYANDAINYVQAAINSNVSLKFNDKKITPVNVDGNEVPILMYEGSSYLPVRSIASIAGLNVGWDGETSTILLSNEEKEVITAEATSILDLKLNDDVKLNTYNDIKMYYWDSHSLLNDADLLTRSDGTIMGPGLLIGDDRTYDSDILTFNADGRSMFNATTIILNKKYSKVTGYVKIKNLDKEYMSEKGQLFIVGIDADMTLKNVVLDTVDLGVEGEFVYFEANVNGMEKVAISRSVENAYYVDDQFIIGDLLFFE